MKLIIDATYFIGNNNNMKSRNTRKNRTLKFPSLSNILVTFLSTKTYLWYLMLTFHVFYTADICILTTEI